MVRAVVGYVLVGAWGLVGLAGSVAAAGSGRQLPPQYRAAPYSVMSLSVGSPASGWQLRAKRLRATQYLHIKERSETVAFGHPALVLMLQRTAKQMVRNVQSEPLLVGDLSSEQGGPLYGHRSHQSGRDADVGFFALDQAGQPRSLDHFVAYDAEGKARDGSGLRFDDYRNWLMVQTWLQDERADIRHVFVAAHLRRRLLAFASSRPAFAPFVDAAAELMLQPHNASPHDDHFHVRIACPQRHAGLCRDQGR